MEKDLKHRYLPLQFSAQLIFEYRYRYSTDLALVSGDGAPLVNGITDDIDDSAQGLGAHGDHDGRTGVIDHLAAHQTLSTCKLVQWKNEKGLSPGNKQHSHLNNSPALTSYICR